MVVLRRTIGDVLRDQRRRQGRTLREVSSTARVSLGYLSEVERGQKEASSELLASICSALDLPLSHVLQEVTQRVADAEGGHERTAGAVRTARSPVVDTLALEVGAPADAGRTAVEHAPVDRPAAGRAAERTVSDGAPPLATLPEELPQVVLPDVALPERLRGAADVLPDDVVDALVDVLPELLPDDLQRALDRRRRRLVSVA